MLYRVEGKQRNRVNLLDGVDVRADGGYIVAPPSIHNNGNRYEWENEPDEYEIAKADDVVLQLLGGDDNKEVENFIVPDKIGQGQRNRHPKMSHPKRKRASMI